MEQPKNDYCMGIHGADGAALWVRIRTMEFPVRPEYPPDMNTDDPIESYLRTFERLRARKRWSMNSVTLRFVALSLGAAATSIDYDRLEEVATELRKRARWTSPLKSEIRYVVAAMILRRGQDPAAIHARVFETRDAFKAHKIPSRGTGATLAALLLALHHEARPGCATADRTVGEGLSPLAQRASLADQFQRPAGGRAACRPRRAGRHCRRGGGARLYQPG